ncbi:hypothetical protein KSP40_PGU001442 [Platanthera guangdongensis]|uniref:Uncharacterized protein n=1 Tax=Platanthera guangdongensis TaxID=2320717 RepID=A0ABR2M927_9ASPA
MAGGAGCCLTGPHRRWTTSAYPHRCCRRPATQAVGSDQAVVGFAGGCGSIVKARRLGRRRRFTGETNRNKEKEVAGERRRMMELQVAEEENGAVVEEEEYLLWVTLLLHRASLPLSFLSSVCFPRALHWSVFTSAVFSKYTAADQARGSSFYSRYTVPDLERGYTFDGINYLLWVTLLLHLASLPLSFLSSVYFSRALHWPVFTSAVFSRYTAADQARGSSFYSRYTAADQERGYTFDCINTFSCYLLSVSVFVVVLCYFLLQRILITKAKFLSSGLDAIECPC